MSGKHFMTDAVIEFTDACPVFRPDGRWCNPFMEHTYAARVKFDDDYTVIVSFFPGAASRRQGEYVKAAYAAAVHARQHDEHLAEVTADES